MSFAKCAMCGKHHVPEIVLSTSQPPDGLDVLGAGTLIEAHVCRYKKIRPGESRPAIISEAIPFAQYDIHRQLMYKLRIQGLNAVFGLKVQFQLGESLLTLVATGTAMYVRALPSPPAMKVFRNLEVLDEEDERLLDIQTKLMTLSESNRRRIELALAQRAREEAAAAEAAAALLTREARSMSRAAREEPIEEGPGSDTAVSPVRADAGSSDRIVPAGATTISSQDELSESMDGSRDNDEGEEDDEFIDDEQPAYPAVVSSRQLPKSVVVQIDDEQDEDLVLLQDTTLSADFSISNVTTKADIAGLEALATGQPLVCQMVSLVKIGHIIDAQHHPNRQFSAIFKAAYQDLNYHLSYLSPCMLTGLEYDVQLHKDNEVQISLSAIAIGMANATSHALEPVDDRALNQAIMEEFFSSDEGANNPRYGGWFKLKPNLRQLTRPFFSLSSPEVILASDSTASLAEPSDAASVDEGAAGAGTAAGTTSVTSGDGVGPIATSGVPNDAEFASHADSVGPVTSHAEQVAASMAAAAAGGPGNDERLSIDITPLSFMPGQRIVRHLGRLSLHFIKESNMNYEPGGVFAC
jgi:hypothetical protein